MIDVNTKDDFNQAEQYYFRIAIVDLNKCIEMRSFLSNGLTGIKAKQPPIFLAVS